MNTTDLLALGVGFVLIIFFEPVTTLVGLGIVATVFGAGGVL